MTAPGRVKPPHESFICSSQANVQLDLFELTSSANSGRVTFFLSLLSRFQQTLQASASSPLECPDSWPMPLQRSQCKCIQMSIQGSGLLLMRYSIMNVASLIRLVYPAHLSSRS